MSMPAGKRGEEDTQTPRPLRPPNTIFITSIIILLLALSTGSFFLVKSQGDAAGHTMSTVSPTIPTTTTPTPTATSNEMYLETPPPQAVFYDTFLNNALGWSITNEVGYIRTLANRRLTLTDTNPNTTLVESLPTNAIYDNFMVTVDLTILYAGENDSVGIYVRGDSNMDHDYRIEINGDNTFDIANEYLDASKNPGATILNGPLPSSALNPPRMQNTIRVIMVGAQLLLFINNTEVTSISDSDYTTGQIALFARAGKASNGVSVSFSRVEVDHPPDLMSGG
jgi:hypothetical protein